MIMAKERLLFKKNVEERYKKLVVGYNNRCCVHKLNLFYGRFTAVFFVLVFHQTIAKEVRGRGANCATCACASQKVGESL